MEKQNKDYENEYKSVDGEIWGSIDEKDQANKAWYDATMLDEELENNEEKPKTRR